MIREALQYIADQRAEPVRAGNKTFIAKGLELADERKLYPKEIQVNTLKSLVDYISDNKDNIDLKKAILHISDYKTVLLYTALDEDMGRANYVKCEATTPEFNFDRFMSIERFNIALQALFCKTDMRDKVLRVTGNIKENHVNESSDDGVTQSVITKKGITLGENETIPNPVVLAPYRTFPEIKQPTSEFILRVQQGSSELQAALFEADGGVWKLEAVAILREELENMLGQKDLRNTISILA